MHFKDFNLNFDLVWIPWFQFPVLISEFPTNSTRKKGRHDDHRLARKCQRLIEAILRLQDGKHLSSSGLSTVLFARWYKQFRRGGFWILMMSQFLPSLSLSLQLKLFHWWFGGYTEISLDISLVQYVMRL